MKVFKKVLSVAMAVVILTSVMVGCGKGTDKVADKEAQSTEPKVTFENAPKIIMAVANQEFDIPMNTYKETVDDNPYVRYIFDKTGIRLQIMLLPKADTEFKQRLAVETAAGNKLDLIKYSLLQQPWIDSGTIVTINSLLEKNKGKIPNIQNNIPESGWRGMKKFDNIWGFPSRGALGKAEVDYLYLRKDWLDNLKLQMPKTTDDLTAILKAFTENDPDGNGKKDTYGIGYDGITTWNKLTHIWGVNTYYEDIVNGNQLVAAAYSDRARASFKTLGTWFKNGYVDPDGVVDSKASQKKRVTNKIGVFWGSAAGICKDQLDLTANGFKDAKWVMLDTPILSSFDKKAYGSAARDNFSSAVFVTATAKDYDSIMKLMEWGYSKEGTFFTSNGIEGREHTMVDGKPVRDPKVTAENRTYLTAYDFAKSYNDCLDKEAYLAKYNNLDLMKQYVDVVMTKSEQITFVPTNIKYQYSDLESFTKYPDWRKGIETYGNKFVLGDLDPMDDKVWKEYIDNSNKYGCQALMDEAAKRYFKK